MAPGGIGYSLAFCKRTLSKKRVKMFSRHFTMLNHLIWVVLCRTLKSKVTVPLCFFTSHFPQTNFTPPTLPTAEDLQAAGLFRCTCCTRLTSCGAFLLLSPSR